MIVENGDVYCTAYVVARNGQYLQRDLTFSENLRGSMLFSVDRAVLYAQKYSGSDVLKVSCLVVFEADELVVD